LFEHLPLIVIEVFFVFGGALAFAWWQLRDLDREKRRREERRGDAGRSEPLPPPAAEDGSSGAGHDRGPLR
jgi:hypothetical protein